MRCRVNDCKEWAINRMAWCARAIFVAVVGVDIERLSALVVVVLRDARLRVVRLEFTLVMLWNLIGVECTVQMQKGVYSGSNWGK